MLNLVVKKLIANYSNKKASPISIEKQNFALKNTGGAVVVVNGVGEVQNQSI